MDNHVFSLGILIIILIGIFSGCTEPSDEQIIYEGLRDAPMNPNHSDYQDYLQNIYKYQELYKMNIDGSSIQRLTDNHYYESQADVSPDGTMIVMSIHYEPEGSMSGIEPGWEIAVMNENGTIINLTNNTWLDTGAHWNYDGTRIVFLSDSAHRTSEDMNPDNFTQIQLDVYTMDADGTNVTQLTFATPGEIFSDPSFSFTFPSKILYIHDSDGKPPQNTDLYMMNADGSNKELLLHHDCEGLQAIAINDPMFSPDGSLVIFEAEMGTDAWGHVIYHMFLYNLITDDITSLTIDENVSEGMAQFSPDGTRITFDRVVWNSASDGTRTIWLADIDGTNATCLSSFRYEGCASWYP